MQSLFNLHYQQTVSFFTVSPTPKMCQMSIGVLTQFWFWKVHHLNFVQYIFTLLHVCQPFDCTYVYFSSSLSLCPHYDGCITTSGEMNSEICSGHGYCISSQISLTEVQTTCDCQLGNIYIIDVSMASHVKVMAFRLMINPSIN